MLHNPYGVKLTQWSPITPSTPNNIACGPSFSPSQSMFESFHCVLKFLPSSKLTHASTWHTLEGHNFISA